MARPRAEIDKNQFEKLCAMMCTEEEIAGFFGVSVDTLQRWCKRTYGEGFGETYSAKKARGKIALRRYQMQLAERYPAMAIFLGKQYLGQQDHPETATEDNTVKVVVERKVQDLTEEGNGDE